MEIKVEDGPQVRSEKEFECDPFEGRVSGCVIAVTYDSRTCGEQLLGEIVVVAQL